MSFSRDDAWRIAMVSESGRRANISTRGTLLSDAEAEAIIEAYQGGEERGETWSRWLVEKYLQHYKWYFPRKDIHGAPSLQKAWTFYECITLPRRLVGGSLGQTGLHRTEPGTQEDTELYNPLRTRQKHLVEFGVGVDLYFQTCALICAMFLIAGLVNIPNIYYYADKYSGQRSVSLQGSAVCTNTYWAVCANCQEIVQEVVQKKSKHEEVANRFALAADKQTLLVLRNDCKIGLEQGIVNWITWLFFFLFLTLASLYLRAREIRFEEGQVTASDYSVVVQNPPPDAWDPEQWKIYFTQFAEKQVTLVSIHLNNEEMLQKLVQRRQQKDTLRRMLPRDTNMDDETDVRAAVAAHCEERDAERKGCVGMFLECTVLWMIRKLGWIQQAETLLENFDSLTAEIKELQNRHYEVSKVYVTFETEEGQRAALSALSANKVDIMMNNTHKVSPNVLFDDRVLSVTEPTEANAVRWTDLSVTYKRRTLLGAITLVLTVGLIVLAALLEKLVREEYGPRWSGVLVAVFNGTIPEVVRFLMGFERHATEEGYQSSLYFKITLFRWVNTAILLQVITPFTSTLGQNPTDLLPSISSILWAETFITPAIRLLDIWSNIQKHILAPRAMTQEQMNLNFLGTPYNLGERYTDLTKVLFVCFFYSALFPASFFFGFAILFVQYYVDKFCLLRIWGFSPSLGNTLAVQSRYFFTGATVAFIIASAYTWAQFPYDNVCDPVSGTITRTETQYPDVVLLSEILTSGEPKTTEVIVGQLEEVFYCAQAFGKHEGMAFPPTLAFQPEGFKWMTESQEQLVNIYYVSVVVALVIFLVVAFLTTILTWVKSWFSSTYKPRGASQKIDFSCVPDIVAYIPQVKLSTYPFPFLAANVDDVDETLLGFTDLDHSVDEHNMIFDVPGYRGIRPKRTGRHPDQSFLPVGESDCPLTIPSGNHKAIFGIVKHYPPPWVVNQNRH